MSTRTGGQIIKDLGGIGIDPKVAAIISNAAGLQGPKAEKFCTDNSASIDLTEAQQARLFEKVLPPYLDLTRRGIVLSVLPRLFQYEFDALVSFTYNLGHLKRTGLASGIDAGRLATVSFHRHGPSASRIRKELSLFTTGIY